MTELARPEVVLDGDWTPLDRALSRASRAMQDTGRTLDRIGRRMALSVTAPLTAIGVVAVKAAVDMDSLRRGLEVSAGSAEAAAGQLNELRRIAELPGLGFKEAIQGAVQLNVAFEGLSNRIPRVNQTLEQFGNAIALTGGGKAELDRVIVQLAQIASAGKILTQDLRPIIQTAPAVATALKQAFGTINAADIEALGLSSEQFFDQLTAALENLPRASGGARNSFENLSDSVFRARAAIGESLLPIVIDIVDAVARFAEGLEDVDKSTLAWTISLGAVAAAIPVVIIAVGSLVSAIGSLVAGFTALSAIIVGGGLAAILTGGALAAGLLAIGAGFAFVYDKVRDAAREVERFKAAVGRDFTGMARKELEEEIALLERRQEILKVGLQQNPLNEANLDLLRKTNRELQAANEALASMAVAPAGPTLAEQLQQITDVNPALLNLTGSANALATNIAFVAEGGENAAAVFGNLDQLAGLTVETFDSAGRSILRFTDEMKEALAITQAMRTPTELFDATLAALQVHLDAGRISWETYERAVRAATDALNEANDAASGGLGIFAKVGSALGRFGSLASIAGLTIPGVGSIAGFSSLIGSFAGGFAEGGYIPSGGWGIVGERGPEIVRGPASVSAGAAPQINVAPARDPISFARDQQWVRAIVEAFRTAEEGGFRPQPG